MERLECKLQRPQVLLGLAQLGRQLMTSNGMSRLRSELHHYVDHVRTAATGAREQLDEVPQQLSVSGIDIAPLVALRQPRESQSGDRPSRSAACGSAHYPHFLDRSCRATATSRASPASAARGDRDLAGRLTVGVEPKGGPRSRGQSWLRTPCCWDCGRLLGTVVEGSECFVDVAELPLLAAEEGVADDTVAVDGVEGRTLAE